MDEQEEKIKKLRNAYIAIFKGISGLTPMEAIAQLEIVKFDIITNTGTVKRDGKIGLDKMKDAFG